MSNIVPLRSMLNSFGRWPSFWDDDDLSLFSGSVGRDVDVYETENEVTVKANVAGVDTKDIDVTFEKGVLWIQAKSETQEEDKKNKYYAKSSWNYSYKVAVPGFIDHSKEPEVSLANGVLTATFSKSEASKPKKLAVKQK